MDVLTLLLVFSLAALFYVYVGYLLLLHLIVRIRGARPIRRAPITPSLTLIISAYNEAEVIRKKIENALALEYPEERREIVVVSDASDDATDGIVGEYASRGVRLFRQTERRGKTAGLNAVLPTVRGEVVVFSDANAIYEKNALLMLARNFADDEVGCVTGEARYLPSGKAIADRGERVYWDYEMQIKRLETALGSMVGGDGAIYAIRKQLWKPLPENAINDFLNPLQIVASGWRAVYEPDAVCFEETAGRTPAEYRRRVRIVSRSWRAVFQATGVLNPVRVGLFAWSVISHKVLRWLSGLFAAGVCLAMFGLYLEVVQRWPAPAVGGLLVVVSLAASIGSVRRTAAMLGYFAVINAASLVGVLKGSVGQVSGVWATPRTVAHETTRGTLVVLPIGVSFLVLLLLLPVGVLVLVPLASYDVRLVTFWGAAGLLAYIYIGYPLALALLRLIARKPVTKRDMEPTVCLFVAAHNEEEVIDAKLRNALALDYPEDRLEIVVASDGSRDGTNDIVRRFAPRVRLLEFRPRRGKAAAINEGLRSVSSEIVVLSDANTFLERTAVRELVRSFADPQVGAASGDVALVGERAALGRSEDIYYRYELWIHHAESDIGSMVGADGALYAVRRELFAPPPPDTILDDMAIPMAIARAGRRVVFEPAARAYEQGSETAREEFSRKTRVIAGAMQFMTRPDSAMSLSNPQLIFSFISHKALRWFSPAFAVSAFLASVLLARTSAVYAVAAAGQAIVVAGGIAGCVPLFRRLSLIAVAHYFCLVQTAAVVGFLRGLTGRQSVLWSRSARVQREATSYHAPGSGR